MTTDWHVPDPLLTRFARNPETLDDDTAASIEEHVVRCAECRSAVHHAVDPAELASSWDLVADHIDRPAATVVERALQLIGMHDGMARLVSATPALSGAWLAAVLTIAAAALAVSRASGADGAYLVLAPLGPLAAVGVTFLAAADPAGEAGVSTPLHGFGLTLRRAVAVLAPTFLLLAGLGLALPGFGGAVSWVLPALALAIGSLALGTWLRVEVASGVLAVLWLAWLAGVRRVEGPDAALADTVAFSAAGQATCAVLAVLAALVLVQRSAHYDTLEAR
jgi:hypothetical protein